MTAVVLDLHLFHLQKGSKPKRTPFPCHTDIGTGYPAMRDLGIEIRGRIYCEVGLSLDAFNYI